MPSMRVRPLGFGRVGIIRRNHMIEQLWNAIQVICAGIIVLGGAGGIMVGLYKWAKKPDQNRDEMLKGHEDKLEKDYKAIQELQKKQDETDEALQVLMRSMLALMSHAIDGNNTDGLRSAKAELQEYLIRR